MAKKSVSQALKNKYMNKKGDFKGRAWTGERFNNCVKYMMAQGKSEDSAKRICAYIGRKKYGSKFQKEAIKGRKQK